MKYMDNILSLPEKVADGLRSLTSQRWGKKRQVGWVHMHTTSKQIELKSPGCSGFEGK